MKTLLQILKRFLYNKAEIEIKSGDFETILTFKDFRCEESEDGTYINIYDSKCEQELSLEVEKTKITTVDNDNICRKLCELQIDDVTIIISSDKVYCAKCKSEIILPYENVWNISGTGNYGSFYDGENINVNICDKCLMVVLGHTEYEERDE